MTGRAAATPSAYRSGRELLARLGGDAPACAVELRPPRRATGPASVEAWIDLHHAVRRLAAEDALVLTTDNAVGAAEEENLRHLRANLGSEADLSRAVPFLTVKHPLEYCLRFPERAAEAGCRALVIVGGDRQDGVPRCVEHAAELRRLLRQRQPSLALGGWSNPFRDPGWQVEMLKRDEAVTDFVLTQVVSHHDLDRVEAFLREAERQELRLPVLFGVFYYRSGNPATLEMLRRVMPVPVDALRQEFAAGTSPGEVCARTVEGLGSLGIRRLYLCNFPAATAAARLASVRAQLEAASPPRPRRL